MEKNFAVHATLELATASRKNPVWDKTFSKPRSIENPTDGELILDNGVMVVRSEDLILGEVKTFTQLKKQWDHSHNPQDYEHIWKRKDVSDYPHVTLEKLRSLLGKKKSIPVKLIGGMLLTYVIAVVDI